MAIPEKLQEKASRGGQRLWLQSVRSERRGQNAFGPLLQGRLRSADRSTRQAATTADAAGMRTPDGVRSPGSPVRIQVSDTQAYRQFGNAVVVPVVEFVAEAMRPHIETALRRQSRRRTWPASYGCHDHWPRPPLRSPPMADVVSPAVRSRMMAGIKGANTRPEMLLRKGLHAQGFRFRLHYRALPGS